MAVRMVNVLIVVILGLGLASCFLYSIGLVAVTFETNGHNDNLSDQDTSGSSYVSSSDVKEVRRSVSALCFLPQYLFVVAYLFSVITAIFDICSAKQNRFRVLAVLLNTTTKLCNLILFGISFIIIIIMMCTLLYFRKSISDAVADETVKQIDTVISWVSFQFVTVMLAATFYIAYSCIWPHTLRRNTRELQHYLISNIDDTEPGGDGDDL